MEVDILFSGSRGNCTLVRSGASEILIDCGKSARAVCTALKELGTDISRISAIFITHEHSDHTSALNVISSKNRIPIHVTSPSSEKLMKQEYTAENLVIHEIGYSVTVGEMEISSFPLPHDSAAHVGYLIKDRSGDTLGIATDMGHVTSTAFDSLSGCRRVIVEANHDVEMLREGPYPSDLKRRILSEKGHLSNPDCASLVCDLAEKGCEVFALAHLSPENNLPDLAYSEVRCALDSSGHCEANVIVTDRHSTVHLPDGPLCEKEKVFEDLFL